MTFKQAVETALKHVNDPGVWALRVFPVVDVETRDFCGHWNVEVREGPRARV